ncbi:Rho termination factor N-terminal domain-containing protein [Clostridium sporogenes]|uniref:Rho termination factor N-terminal domain-containing protein n=1 Tax=Clostridium sporogenes TaxID=1509 RepID=UPI0013D77533|nr:Rho termination factor N-terminal domain-containing protein [Clostridium sporogenes]NFP92409.1 transcription termination factor Rho [Clostridium sporogenes]
MYRLIRDNVERVVNDEHIKDKLIKQRYKLIKETQNVQKDLKKLNDLTIEELRELAKGKGIEGISKFKKDELIEVLEGSE